jgi:hypothetical protein
MPVDTASARRASELLVRAAVFAVALKKGNCVEACAAVLLLVEGLGIGLV